MACTTCGPETQGQCDACKLVDGDNRFKKVFFCETCKAYLCKDCSDNLPKRALAAGMDFGNKVIKRITKYWELKFGNKEELVASIVEEIKPELKAEEIKLPDEHEASDHKDILS